MPAKNKTSIISKHPKQSITKPIQLESFCKTINKCLKNGAYLCAVMPPAPTQLLLLVPWSLVSAHLLLLFVLLPLPGYFRPVSENPSQQLYADQAASGPGAGGIAEQPADRGPEVGSVQAAQ